MMYALLSRYMNIPFPEELTDMQLVRKMRQLDWLLRANHLPVKMENGNGFLTEEKNTNAKENED